MWNRNCLPPRVSSCEHVSGVKRTCTPPTKTHSIVSQSLAALVEEENVIHELDGKCFADTRAQCMDDTSSHETSIRSSLRSAEQAKHKLEESEVVDV